MKTILITGAKGFIGSSLLGFLQPEHGFKIFTSDITDGETIDYVADLQNLESLRFVKEISPEVVIHLGAQTSGPASFLDPLHDLSVNAIGTMNLLTALSDVRVKNFIYVNSGGAIYGSGSLLPIEENSPTNPESPYAISKLTGEHITQYFAERYGMEWSSLALSNCYGNFSLNPKGVMFEFHKHLVENLQSNIYGKDVTRDFVYIDDVLEAIKLAIFTPTNCRVNISSGKEITLESLYLLMSSILGKDIQPRILDPIRGQVFRSCLDNERAGKLLGWEPKFTLEQGLRRILKIDEASGGVV